MEEVQLYSKLMLNMIRTSVVLNLFSGDDGVFEIIFGDTLYLSAGCLKKTLSNSYWTIFVLDKKLIMSPVKFSADIYNCIFLMP